MDSKPKGKRGARAWGQATAGAPYCAFAGNRSRSGEGHPFNCSRAHR
jgi:hypothetical protein